MMREIATCALFLSAHAIAEQARSYQLCGYHLNSPIGIAACPLTTAQHIDDVVTRGYAVITHKTIRSHAHPATSQNVYPVECMRQLGKEDSGAQLSLAPASRACMHALTNCFGNNSKAPDETRADIARVRAALHDGQLLIVSIYGVGKTDEALIADFIAAARIAYDGGAQIIEANCSCPNVKSGLLYRDPVLVEKLCRALTAAVPIPIFIKIGPNYDALEEIICAACRGGARGIVGINTLPMRVVASDGKPVYGEDNPMSGVSGAPLFALAHNFVREARAIIDAHQLDCALLATGGVMRASDFQELLHAGADIALCATSALFDNDIAHRYKRMFMNVPHENKKNLAQNLYHIGTIQFKEVKLKSGAISPIYCDARLIMSYPSVLRRCGDLMTEIVKNNNASLICGVPYGALPIATVTALKANKPLIMLRKEAKDHGNKKLVEGAYKSGDTCLLIEDVITTGASVLEVINTLRDHDVRVTDVCVLIDREQGGRERIEAAGYRVHALFTLSELLEMLREDQMVTDETISAVRAFCREHHV